MFSTHPIKNFCFKVISIFSANAFNLDQSKNLSFRTGFTYYHRITTFNAPKKKCHLKTIVRKGENAGNQHFLHFPQCFQSYFLLFMIKNLLYSLPHGKILDWSIVKIVLETTCIKRPLALRDHC